MARSVYTPYGAQKVVYADVSYMEDSWEWDFCETNFAYEIKAKYPSLKYNKEGKWIGNEGKVILENELVAIVVSEYNGIVAVSAVPQSKYNGLAKKFANEIKLEDFIQYYGDELICRGSFSNGEALFDRKNGNNKGALGLGYSSKEGWI
jgi:hypothetical protein